MTLIPLCIRPARSGFRVRSLALMFRLAAIGLLTAFTTTGCGEQQAGSDPARFVFASGSEHHHLDPQRISWRHDFRLAGAMWEGLVRRDVNTAIEPAIAASWDVSEDQLTYTFHLREARWSNGDPVRAGDFVYAWRRALMPDLAADYAKLFFPIAGAEDFFRFRNQQLADYANAPEKSEQAARDLLDEAYAHFEATVGVATPDDRTLVVTLARPTTYFIELCAFGTYFPQNPAVLDQYLNVDAQTGFVSLKSDWTQPGALVTNGAYVLAERSFKQFVRLKANPEYWDRDAVGPKMIEEQIIEQPQTALLRYSQGQVDWIPDIPTASSLAADLVRENRPDVHALPAAGTYFYNFNCNPTFNDGSPNPLANPDVRRALSLAIDRQSVVQQVTRLNQPIARTFVPIGALPDYDPPVEAGVLFDPQAARQALRDAGYRTPDHPDGPALEGLSILVNSGFGHENIAQQIAQTWRRELGVTVTLDALESSQFGERLKSQNYAIARAGWFGDYRDATTYLDKFRSANGNNDAAYDNPRFDELMTQADATLDPSERNELMRQAEALMLSESPIAPIFQYTELHVFDPQRVGNFPLNPWHMVRLDRIVLGE